MVLREDASGLKRQYLYLRGHINYIPDPQNPRWGRFDEAWLGCMALDASMH